MEKIRQSLRDNKAARWGALGIVSITMFAGYFLTDVMSPLKPMLESQFGWSSTSYGLFTSAYGWFNVFLGLLIIGGIILDKMGVRFTGLMASAIMVVGASIKFWAVSNPTLPSQEIFGMQAQVFYAALGFATFGVGVEIAGITVSKIIVKWFKGYEMALAMGMQMAVARMGTLLAMAAPVPLAMYFSSKHTQVVDGQLIEKMGPSISAPIAFALVLLVIGFIAFFIYVAMDKKLETSEIDLEASNEEEFKFSDIVKIIGNKGFWLIAILCVLFYSSVFPFIKYASDLMVNKYHVDQSLAGLIPSLLPLGTLFLTPFFGGIYDNKGKGATMMIIGASLIVLVHGVFSLPILNYWMVAVVLVIILGIALSLVPSAMWPSVPKIIPENQLGTAFSLIFWIQNWGLMGIPLLIGYVLDQSNPEVLAAKAQIANGVEGVVVPLYDYTNPMLIFAGLGVLAIVVGFMLKAEDKKMGYGLQLPNIKS